jgi:5-methyltetrahydrofolate--homocysteine methyltransferase
LDAARANPLDFAWETYSPPKPQKPEVHVVEPRLADLVPYIDWSPYFMTWELAGKFPQILEDEVVGEAATSLWQDTQERLAWLIEDGRLQAKGVVGIWPANRLETDDIRLYTSESRDTPLADLHHLRQQAPKPDDLSPNLCLADYVAPAGIEDYVGGFAVTSGLNLEAILEDFPNDDFNQIMIKALADRFAEAFAEFLHERVRQDLWGYAADEALDKDALIKERYQGIRPAPGYPACPEHSEKETLFHLLDATTNTGISLTDSYAMSPAAAVSGWYFSHPEARYFGVGKIDDDQVRDYAARKALPLDQAKGRLQPLLSD